MNMHDLIGGIEDRNEYFDMIDADEMTDAEKEKAIQSALEAIKIEQGEVSIKGSGKGIFHKKSRRRVLLVAAAIGIILALGSVAYATDFFGLGSMIFMGGSLQTESAEDSNQFQAMKEYNDYRNSLSKKESAKLDKEWEDASYAAGEHDNENTYTITYYAPDKIRELCKKYDLVIEKKEYTAKDASDALNKADIPDFIGSFDLGAKDEYGQSVYTDKGAAFLMQDGYELECVPNDVFRTVSIWKWQDDGSKSQAEDEPKIIKEWSHATKSGHSVRGMITESPEGEYFCSFIVPTQKYTVTFSKNVDESQANEKYVKGLTEQFDFSKLD